MQSVSKAFPRKSLSFAAFMFAALSSAPLAAADLQMMKPGEWGVEVVESSLGPATSAIKTKPFCVDEKDGKKDWESLMKDEMRKTELDCKLDKLKQDASILSYHVDCTATELAKGKSGVMPVGSKVEGTLTMTRESDKVYILDQDTKATGLKAPAAELAKVPEAQRKMLEGVLAMSSGSLKFKMKQKYTYAKAVCTKNEKVAK
ncbi:MAG: hypothetical protein H7249_20400 [Chitinophagaceae bacterium]|nr:hypothetical protein [Oligoflexus sp.]